MSFKNRLHMIKRVVIIEKNENVDNIQEIFKEKTKL